MCRPVGTLPSEAYEVWFETPYGRDTEVARKISVVKSLGYCAFEVNISTSTAPAEIGSEVLGRMRPVITVEATTQVFESRPVY